MDARPIGIYDSGVGGLTVVRQVRCQLPDERILYFGDTARVPYGGRPAHEIEAFARQIVSYLEMLGSKLVIIACNTTSALALDKAKLEFDLPLVGVIRPGAYAASRASPTGRIGVIGTEGTVRSGAYERAIAEFAPHAQVVSQGCPLLAHLVEAGEVHSPEMVKALQEYLAPLVNQDIDALVLGCTHYPYLAEEIRRIVGPSVAIVDPAEETVRATSALLSSLGLASPERTGRDELMVSGDPERFASVAEGLLGYPLPGVKKVSLSESPAPCNRESAAKGVVSRSGQV